MTWGEAVRLTKILLRDSSSQVAASAEGWKFPIDRATLATLDLFDLTVRANSDPKKGSPKPHGGRPFEVDDRARQSIGKTGGRSRAEIVEILRGLGHNIPV